MRLIWELSLLLTGCPEPAPTISRVEVVDAICVEWKTSLGARAETVYRCESSEEVCFLSPSYKGGLSLSCYSKTE